MHACSAAVVTCEDFRLHPRGDGRNFIGEFIRSLGVDADLITRGGCIQDLVRPEAGFDVSLLRDLDVSTRLHGVTTIYLIGHENCGAYGRLYFADRTSELDRHFADLREARAIIHDRFPDVAVELRFAELVAGATDEWCIVEVSTER